MVTKTEHKSRSGCPIACSLDVLGDHWTLIIVRNLMFHGCHEYKDMLQAEEQISSSILSDRLKKLEENGLIASCPHPDSQRRKLYYLTDTGKDLIHLMQALLAWSITHLAEHLDVPEMEADMVMNHPKEFISGTLARLAKWENEHLTS